MVSVEPVTRMKTRSFWAGFSQKRGCLRSQPSKIILIMVISVKPLPNASDEATVGKGHELQPKTVMNSGYFWDNYCKFRPILKVNKTLYLGRWTFVELHHFQDKLEGRWIILGHKMHEGRAWIKAKGSGIDETWEMQNIGFQLRFLERRNQLV